MPYSRNNTRTSYRAYPRPRPYGRPTLSGHGAYRYRSGGSRRIYGRGAYTVENGPWANRGAGLGGAIGQYYGGSVGRKLGSWVGRRAFHYPAKLFGSGEYTEVPAKTSNDGPSRKLAPQVPYFADNSKDDSVVISHREYLGDVITSDVSGAFNIQHYALNPSEVNSFPWLSNIAQPNYQQYKFEGLAFEFKSFSADALNSTNTALGSVFACINYDYTDYDLASRYEVENTDWSSSCKPSENMLIPVECAPRQTGMNGLLYVVNGNTVPPNADPKMYYLGKMWIGTTGFQGTNVNIGSLYVTYKIRLYKPVMTRPLSNGLIHAVNRQTYDTSNMFGTVEFSSPATADSVGISYSGNVMTLSHERLVIGQRFQLCMVWNGVTAAAFTAPTVTHSGAQGQLYFSGFGLPSSSAPSTGSVTSLASLNNVFMITDNRHDVTITLGGSPSLPTGTNNVQILLVQICGVPLHQIGEYTP